MHKGGLTFPQGQVHCTGKFAIYDSKKSNNSEIIENSCDLYFVSG